MQDFGQQFLSGREWRAAQIVPVAVKQIEDTVNGWVLARLLGDVGFAFCVAAEHEEQSKRALEHIQRVLKADIRPSVEIEL